MGTLLIVVDTNVIAHFFSPGALTTLTQRAYAKATWCAPLLWRSEYRNVLASHYLAGSLDSATARELMNKAERLMWGREFSVRSSTVLNLIETSNRSAYDCEFIALAQDFGTSLITADEPVIREFPAVAIHLREYVGRS